MDAHQYVSLDFNTLFDLYKEGFLSNAYDNANLLGLSQENTNLFLLLQNKAYKSRLDSLEKENRELKESNTERDKKITKL